MVIDKDKIKDTIREYHERFYPEAIVDFVEIRGDRLIFRFEGHFCYTCGVSDYFDDFALFLTKNLGKEYVVESKKQYGRESDIYWIVEYAPRSNVKRENVEKGKVSYIILDPDTGEQLQEIDI